MTTGQKIQKLRREANVTQEQLADRLEVSRQSVSKWESDLAYPETEKLIRLAEFFGVTVDELLREAPGTGAPSFRAEEKGFSAGRGGGESSDHDWRERFHYEYKSEKTLFGLPLVHVNVGLGFYRARGIVSVGAISKGLISIGILSMGLLSLGVLSLGVLALGALSLGVLALGAAAMGIIALGAVAVGLFSLGALSVGLFSAGACSVGHYAAIGDFAYGNIAVGFTRVGGGKLGILSSSPAYSREEVANLIRETVPAFWRGFANWIAAFLPR